MLLARNILTHTVVRQNSSQFMFYISECVCVCVLNSIEASHLIPLTGYSVATGYLTGNNIQGLQSFKEKKIL